MNNASNSNSILDKYIIKNKIGNGKFGTVYGGIHKKTKREVVLKFENGNSSLITLKNEATILRYLYDHQCRDIPSIFWFGKINDNFTLIINKYDCSLFEFIKNNNISLETANKIMFKIICLFQDIHDLFVLHRDIKPHHFMIRNGDLYLIDFGISTFYVNEKNTIIENTKKTDIIGSPNYTSYFIHKGNTYSRRDDLISIGYLYIFIINETLPWEKSYEYAIDEKNDNNYTSIYHPFNIEITKKKELTYLNEYCSKMDNTIITYLSKVYKLDYYDTPNYVDYSAIFYY
tara:strand:+ start:27401 stop:28264 length:864 start_codon:yes stop_codon:yes gene_type:complete